MKFPVSFLNWRSQRLKESEKLKVLVSPLDWGLGHASRMILLIQELINKGFEIIIAADKAPLELLEKEFPQLKSIKLAGASIKYSKGNNQFFSILKFLPKFAKSIKTEHKELQKIIKKYQIDVVISDNRYGLWNKNIYSILVTHQLKLKLPKTFAFAENLTKHIIYRFSKDFNEIWIPDFEEKTNLSGELSHFKSKLSYKIHFIGILSKFLLPKFQKKSEKEKINQEGILAILSGPEPQRTVFEELLIKQLDELNCKATIVLGKQNYKPKLASNSKIKLVAFVESKELYKLINEAKYVICRAGYSSIMDMVALNKKAIIVPTPGQTEQEYLAKYLKNNELFTVPQLSELYFLSVNFTTLESCGTVISQK